MSICRVEIAIRLSCNHFVCTGFKFKSDAIRRSERREIIKVMIATMGVKEQAMAPGGRKSSNPKIINAAAPRFRMIVNKTMTNKCRRQFAPNPNLRTRMEGRGPEMRGGRNARNRKNRVCMEAIYPDYSDTKFAGQTPNYVLYSGRYKTACVKHYRTSRTKTQQRLHRAPTCYAAGMICECSDAGARVATARSHHYRNNGGLMSR